jgi:hypothetical protein
LKRVITKNSTRKINNLNCRLPRNRDIKTTVLIS